MNGFKLSARVPFVSTAAGDSQLAAYGDWNFMPSASPDGFLLWNYGRGAGTIQLFFAGVPSGTWKCDISCHIGNGQVMLFAGNAIPNPQLGPATGVVSTNEFTVNNSGLAFAMAITMGNLDHFTFFSATLETVP
jgi:hypothetical protein